MKTGFRFAILLLTTALLSACGSSHTVFKVDSTPTTNQGRSFYMVVRTVDERAFLADTYEAVASKVFGKPSDLSIVKSEAILPGITHQFSVRKPQDENQQLAVYFFFTNPGENWKSLIPAPLPDKADFVLQGNEILDQEID